MEVFVGGMRYLRRGDSFGLEAYSDVRLQCRLLVAGVHPLMSWAPVKLTSLKHWLAAKVMGPKATSHSSKGVFSPRILYSLGLPYTGKRINSVSYHIDVVSQSVNMPGQNCVSRFTLLR